MLRVEKILYLLACPSCRADSLAVEEYADGNNGLISCAACKRTYNVIDDIPRFQNVSSEAALKQHAVYSHYHSLHTKEKTFRTESYSKIVLATVGCNKSEMENSVVLDAGCGIGRYSAVLASLASNGVVVAMDLSDGVDSAKKNLVEFDNCYVIQGDVTNPPLRDAVFDIVFSWGVLHHTPNVRSAFASVSRKTKIGGRLGVFLYEFHPVYAHKSWALTCVALFRQFALILPLRALCTRLPIPAVRAISRLCWLAAATTRFDPFGVASGPPGQKFLYRDWYRVFIDRFRTRYASEHSYQEIIDWFNEENYDDVIVPHGCSDITISGRKGRCPSTPMHCRFEKPLNNYVKYKKLTKFDA